MTARWPELPVELLVAGAAAATTGLGVWAELAWTPYPIHGPFPAYALALVAAGVLVARRRRPVLVTAVGLACLAGYHAAGYPGGSIAMVLFVGFYAIPVYAEGKRMFTGCAVGISLVIVVLALPPHAQPWYSFALLGPAFGMAWMVVLGAAARARRLATEAYIRRAELQLREGLAEERLRIARELHDILAHTISVIAVQAGVALDSLDTAPEEARAAMVRVRAVAAEARPELRAALGLLRAESGTPDMLAQPGLDQLGDLVAKTRAAGLATTLDVAADLPPLPAFTQLTVYRIAQESLTNVVRHARAAEATVTLRAEDGELRVRVRDDGAGGVVGAQSGGLGIAGMRERVQLLGGTLHAGPAPGGGFLLDACIPLEPS